MKKTEIVERLDAMQEEIDSLRAHIDEQAAATTVTYVRELHRPPAVSEPLDVIGLAAEVCAQYVHYGEFIDDWGINKYL